MALIYSAGALVLPSAYRPACSLPANGLEESAASVKWRQPLVHRGSDGSLQIYEPDCPKGLEGGRETKQIEQG